MSELRILRDLPGIADLTARLDAAGWPEIGPLLEETDDLSLMLFGVTETDAEDARRELDLRESMPPVTYRTGMARDLEGDGPPAKPAKPISSREWDEKIELSFIEFDPSADTRWRELGWDVTDGAGGAQPALDKFSLQILCATHGLCGELQDFEFIRRALTAVEEDRARTWARDLQAEAAKRIESKRDEGPKFTSLISGAGGRTIRPPKPLRKGRP